ncbi:hypothetical protein [Halomicrobium salinisoli]|uniref:hypothetical protein n=1 Tax=Halomicrobium salinisoli TaxID=2878391 RepID=UPI001CF00EC3|nr:hypothetical protein [Halomicrobium salinisoli]
MSTDPQKSLKQAGRTVSAVAMQLTILAVAAIVFLGLSFLVYRQRIQPDVLLFGSGVILGVLMKAFIDAI